MYDVVALGELLIDFACVDKDESGYPRMAAHPGGAPANFLAALAKYGAKTALIGKVGNDAFGQLLLGTLREAGIDDKGVVSDENIFTTLAFVTFNDEGDRCFSFARKPGADTQLRVDEIPSEMLESTKIFHFGTLSLTDEPAKTATFDALNKAKELGKLITYDPNLRKPLWKSLEDAKVQIEAGLRYADIVKISDEEVEFLWNLPPEAGAEKILNEFGVRLVFVTCGANGCFFMNGNAHGFVPSLRDIHVIDTTGAGDIFGGSAVWKFLQTGKKPEELDEIELFDIVRFATAAAGLSVTKAGGISSVPSYKEICERLQCGDFEA